LLLAARVEFVHLKSGDRGISAPEDQTEHSARPGLANGICDRVKGSGLSALLEVDAWASATAPPDDTQVRNRRDEASSEPTTDAFFRSHSITAASFCEIGRSSVVVLATILPSRDCACEYSRPGMIGQDADPDRRRSRRRG